MSDLIGKLNQAIDEAEQHAKEHHRYTKAWLGPQAGNDCSAMLNPYEEGCDCGHPQAILRHVEEDRKVLERHKPEQGTTQFPTRRTRCSYCWDLDREGGDHSDYGTGRDWPCPDVISLANRYGIELDTPFG